jgi:hypothetical protein
LFSVGKPVGNRASCLVLIGLLELIKGDVRFESYQADISRCFRVHFVSVTADLKGPYVMTVDEVRESQPGPKWDPNYDEVLVQVRGYLRDSINLYLYATKDQALLDDISGILVSDEGVGDLRRNCSEGFVELIARLGWMETERRPLLIPTEAKKLILQGHRRAEEQQCRKTANTTDR